MDVKGEVLLQLFSKSKIRNGTRTFLEQKFFYIEWWAPLILYWKMSTAHSEVGTAHSWHPKGYWASIIKIFFFYCY